MDYAVFVLSSEAPYDAKAEGFSPESSRLGGYLWIRVSTRKEALRLGGKFHGLVTAKPASSRVGQDGPTFRMTSTVLKDFRRAPLRGRAKPGSDPMFANPPDTAGNPVRAASTRGSLSGIDRKAIRAGDILVYRKVNYVVDNVMKPEDYTAVGLAHIADLMRKQRVIAELVVFKPSTAKHRPSVAKPEKRYAMKVYQNGKLSAPQSKTLGQVPAGRVK